MTFNLPCPNTNPNFRFLALPGAENARRGSNGASEVPSERVDSVFRCSSFNKPTQWMSHFGPQACWEVFLDESVCEWKWAFSFRTFSMDKSWHFNICLLFFPKFCNFWSLRSHFRGSVRPSARVFSSRECQKTKVWVRIRLFYVYNNLFLFHEKSHPWVTIRVLDTNRYALIMSLIWKFGPVRDNNLR